ncbi:MAG: VOC family protein [Leucobacter sp.]|nr:VOC family protein [Leucobacter sp.]
MSSNATKQQPPAARRSSRLLLAVIGGALLVALIAGAAWWFTSRADAAGSSAQFDANGVPVERADGLPAETSLGVNELRVRAFDEVAAFYQDAVGLEVLEESAGDMLLGLEKEPLIRLIQSEEPLPSPTDAGLFHTAILFPDEAALAATLLLAAEHAPGLYQGSADHLVSEAFYFGDPEGNGVELYVDRPRAEWQWEDGKVKMDSLPLDPTTFINEHLPEGGADEARRAATVGHVHLKVGDLDEARAFYADALGFDVVSEGDGALFYSAGGYHHHLATNTWQSAGAGPRTTEVGLGAVTVALPDAAAVDAVAARLDDADAAYERVERGIVAADPWGNTLRLIAAASR